MKIDEPLQVPQTVPDNVISLTEAQERRQQLYAALEGLLFVHGKPLSVQLLGETLGVAPEEAMPLILAVKERYDSDPQRGLQIVINEQGVQLATKASIATFIQKLEGQRLVNLSLPALETLSVIAYKQPITRAEVEAIRGVNCDGVMSTLLEKKLIYVSGEKPVIGKPRLYSTTSDFLYYFGIKSLKELPVPAVDVDPAALKEAAAAEAPQLEVEGVVAASAPPASTETTPEGSVQVPTGGDDPSANASSESGAPQTETETDQASHTSEAVLPRKE
ncbi:MAG TPA: SMC-Scp complex subunit ScpB [Candidatus Ozemobacteraceae bacterium]|nr:SMC-Scp complex subunit ScpB [Candidatus Ozemobacteraceae bacterium]